MKELAEKTEQGFKELIEALPEDKYPRARAHIENQFQNVTTVQSDRGSLSMTITPSYNFGTSSNVLLHPKVFGLDFSKDVFLQWYISFHSSFPENLYVCRENRFVELILLDCLG